MDAETLALLKEISAKLDILLERTEPKKRRPFPDFAVSMSYQPLTSRDYVNNPLLYEGGLTLDVLAAANATLDALDANNRKRAFVADAMDQE